MKIRTVAPLLLSLLSMNAVSKEYIRYNSAGYFTSGQKKIVINADNDLTGKTWSVKGSDGSSVANGTIGDIECGKGDHSAFNFNYIVDFSTVQSEGSYTFTLDGSNETATLSVADKPYNKIIASHLRWLKSQRSGTDATVDHKVGHLGDSASYIYRQKEIGKMDWKNWTEDENGLSADMLGGWYASGNYGKFTSAIGYTTYYLLKSYQANPALFDGDAQLSAILEEAKFGIDYLLGVMPSDKDFIIQVGGFDGENGIRLPHEDVYDGKRIAYSSFSTPQMAWASAALALAHNVFSEKGDAALATQCKEMAVKIYAKATSPEATIAWLQKDYEQFKDDSNGDNLIIAAAELHKATGDAKYLADAKTNSDKIKNAWWIGWNMQHMMAHSLITEEHPPAKKYFMEDLNNFAGNSKGNIWGLPMEYSFSCLYASIEIGVAAARYQLLSDKNKFGSLISNVLDYEFGVNNWGVSFTANKTLPNSVKNFNLPIYKLQTRLFPEGAIALGPCDTEGHDGESKWILDDVSANYCHPFNTKKIKFYDHADDYMTTDSWIFGAADNIYFITLATTLFNK